jgi:hypothetical protein
MGTQQERGEFFFVEGVRHTVATDARTGVLSVCQHGVDAGRVQKRAIIRIFFTCGVTATSNVVRNFSVVKRGACMRAMVIAAQWERRVALFHFVGSTGK